MIQASQAPTRELGPDFDPAGELAEYDGPFKVARLSDTQAGEDFPAALALVAEPGDLVLIERDGEGVAALIPIEDYVMYKRLFEEEEDRRDVAKIEAVLAANEPSVSWEQVKNDLGLEP